MKMFGVIIVLLSIFELSIGQYTITYSSEGELYVKNGAAVSYKCELGTRYANSDDLLDRRKLKCNFYDEYGNVAEAIWLQPKDNEIFKRPESKILSTSSLLIMTLVKRTAAPKVGYSLILTTFNLANDGKIRRVISTINVNPLQYDLVVYPNIFGNEDASFVVFSYDPSDYNSGLAYFFNKNGRLIGKGRINDVDE